MSRCHLLARRATTIIMLFYCSTALGKGKEVTIYAGKDKAS